MAAEGDFLARYRSVSNKLKKRFLRKPNVAEASEQFGQLAKELKQQDCLQYAAFCNLAMARCEQTLFNAPGEALALTDAARLFLSSEKESRSLQAPGFDEHLQAALNCYSFAIKVYIEMNQPVMAASLCLELGNALKEMNRPGEAIVHYQRAAELQTQTPTEALLSMGEMATCKILTRDYDGALSVFTEMHLICQERGLQLPDITTPIGAFLDIIAKCEISRVLLLMLLERTSQKQTGTRSHPPTFPDVLGDTPHHTIRWRKMARNYLAEGALFQPHKTHTNPSFTYTVTQIIFIHISNK
ncbi:40-kDa huntingtin-associated protein isoform X2 [Mugil cephalus]|uniref:40-kDa huntingtin-associated protein isoform X2 n=1 Tax=Mugil cephalus TaxID=48193 RepID=UPI001FB6C398|nr:40-kDa huntingtin-associated protein isoform X2 [Mugil cephalus]